MMVAETVYLFSILKFERRWHNHSEQHLSSKSRAKPTTLFNIMSSKLLMYFSVTIVNANKIDENCS